MITVSDKDAAHVPALECCPELIRLKEFTRMTSRRIEQLVTLLMMALAAQPGSVVSSEPHTTGPATVSRSRAGTARHGVRSRLP
ncbi:MAG: hypothetical protein LC776_20220 [Acidobacteria bacterium]|nr:hypothetical protein [Acidobacteriota bacterium]